MCMKEYWISIIEGILYMVGDEGLTVEQLASVTELDPLVIEEYLEEIKFKGLDFLNVISH